MKEISVRTEYREGEINTVEHVEKDKKIENTEQAREVYYKNIFAVKTQRRNLPMKMIHSTVIVLVLLYIVTEKALTALTLL